MQHTLLQVARDWIWPALLIASFCATAEAADSDAAIQPGAQQPPISEDKAQGFLYGRVITVKGSTYEGRLRFGGNEEAFWDQYFNGVRDTNPWARHVPPSQLNVSKPIEILGITLGEREQPMDLERPVMVRFGDIRKITASGRDLTVRLKGGAVFELDRYEADDFADGLRVWDRKRGVVDLDEWDIASIEFLPTPLVDSPPARLYAEVATAQGRFSGFIQWDREACVGNDLLVGRSADGEQRIRFDTITALERHSVDSTRVILRDGRQVVLSNARGEDHRGVYVEDRRYGRVLVAWDVFRRMDISLASSGPGYEDFPQAGPLEGQVVAQDGRRFNGRLVFDLDESQTTETLDAPGSGVDYTIPFGLIESIQINEGSGSSSGVATVQLYSGESLPLEREGDLGARNAGLLIFSGGPGDPPDYLPWVQVQRIELDRPDRFFPISR